MKQEEALLVVARVTGGLRVVVVSNVTENCNLLYLVLIYMYVYFYSDQKGVFIGC
jgi:hypothetical protein